MEQIIHKYDINTIAEAFVVSGLFGVFIGGVLSVIVWSILINRRRRVSVGIRCLMLVVFSMSGLFTSLVLSARNTAREIVDDVAMISIPKLRDLAYDNGIDPDSVVPEKWERISKDFHQLLLSEGESNLVFGVIIDFVFGYVEQLDVFASSIESVDTIVEFGRVSARRRVDSISSVSIVLILSLRVCIFFVAFFWTRRIE